MIDHRSTNHPECGPTEYPDLETCHLYYYEIFSINFTILNSESLSMFNWIIVFIVVALFIWYGSYLLMFLCEYIVFAAPNFTEKTHKKKAWAAPLAKEYVSDMNCLPKWHFSKSIWSVFQWSNPFPELFIDSPG